MAGHVKAATEAIGRGVPLFNAGDTAGCAAVYTRAVASAAIDPGLGQVGRAVCRVGLDRAAAAAAAMDPGAMAATATAVTGRASWMLRSVLDFLVDTQGGTKNVPQPTQLDFADPGAAAAFRAVDDSVMGGSSRSGMESRTGYSTFCGELVLAGGGFASVRASSSGGGGGGGGGTPAFFFGGSPGISVDARGDGHLYKLVVRDADAGGPDGVSYQAEFTPVAGAFNTIVLPWASFKASWRGRPRPDAPPINPIRVGSVGLMISRIYDDGRTNSTVNSGSFHLDVRGIRGAPLPSQPTHAATL